MAARKSSAYVSRIPFVLIEAVGFGLSSYLFMISSHLIGGKLPCARSKWIACESAVQGPFSHIGPLSVAAMGVIYYVIHLALSAGLRDRAAQICKVLLVAGGLVFVAWLRSLEIVWLKKLCPWCWGVAALTLIHAGFTWMLAAPPLPRLRPVKLGFAIFIGFLLLVGVVTMAELGVKSGHYLLNQGGKSADKPEDPESAKSEVTPAPVKAPKQSRTPAVVASTTPAATAAVAAQPTAAPTPSPTPAAAALPAEPEVIDTPETRILKNRGWRHAGSTDDVKKIIKARAQVLLLVYDPFCNDCHDLITKTLDSNVLKDMPVLKVAIQQDRLTGDLSSMAGNEVPVLMLFSREGGEASMPYKHVGSTITQEQLRGELKKVLPATPAAASASGTPTP
jgi:uncharacterized membrane protein